MAYQMVATALTLNDLECHLPVADVFKCNPSNICAAFYTISTDNVLAWFLCTSRASCSRSHAELCVVNYCLTNESKYIQILYVPSVCWRHRWEILVYS